MFKVLAGIVLYNAKRDRLLDCITSIAFQVDKVILIDNSTLDENVLSEITERYTNIVYVHNEKNRGIAKALNQILDYASDNGYNWFITLDQDSVVQEGLVKEYIKHIENDDVAMLTCQMKDYNVGEYEVVKAFMTMDVIKCITSGCFCRTQALLDVNGFDDVLFIDYVDFDICLRLRLKGYRILKINFIGLLHEIGKAKRLKIGNKYVKIGGNYVDIYNEPPVRTYYFFRNVVFFLRKYKKEAKGYTSIPHIIWRALLVVLFESPKGIKIKKIWLGIRDGLRMEIE